MAGKKEVVVPEAEVSGLSNHSRAAVFRQLTRMLLSCSDFSQAMSAAAFLAQEFDESANYALQDWRKFRCYETTLIVSYARPFAGARGGAPTFGFKAVDVTLTDNERALHDRIIELRNKLYGHSDADHVEMSVMCMHEVFAHNGVEMNLIMPRFDETTRLSQSEMLALTELASKLYHAAFRKIQEIGAQFKDRFRVLEMDISRRVSDT